MARTLAACAALTLCLAAPAAHGAEEEAIPPPLGRLDSFRQAFKDAKELDFSKAVAVQGFDLQYDSMKLSVADGVFVPRLPVDGTVFSVVFVGNGRFTFTPPDKVEADELEMFTGDRALDKPVTQGLFYFHDGLWERVAAAGKPATLDRKQTSAANDVWKSRKAAIGELWTFDEFTDLGLTVTIGLAEKRPTPFMVADLKLGDVKKGKDWITYMYNPKWREEVVLLRLWPYPLNPDRWYGESLCAFNEAKDRARPMREQAYEDKSEIDVRNYVADFSIYKDATDDKVWLKAQVEVQFTSRVDDLRTLRMTLIEENDEEDLMVRAVTADGQTPLPYVHQGGEIAVELPKAMARDEQGSITFLYSGPIISVIVQPQPKATIQEQSSASEDDKTALQLVSYGLLNTYPWFPQTPQLSDRYTWDWTIRVQQPLEAAVSGTTIDEKIDGKFKVLRVKEEVNSVLPAIIVGRYSVFRDTFQLPDGRSVVVRVYAHPGKQSEVAKDLLDQAKDCLRVFSQYFGPYPYQELDLAQMAYGVGFAQAPAGLVQMTGEVYLTKTFLATFFRFRDPQLAEYFIPHEVAHQWWGHRVGWLTYRDQWMSETLAEFSAALFMEVARGEKGYSDRRETWVREGGYKSSKTGPLWLGGRNQSDMNPDRYRMTVYRRGPLLMDKLLHDLGREKLMLALRATADLIDNNQAATEDLQKAFESATGLGFEDFFRLFVRDNVDLNTSPEDLAAILAGKAPASGKGKGSKKDKDEEKAAP